MPTYHARNITVRLGSIPLAETTTSNIVLRKGDVAKRQSELTEKKLIHSSYLREKRVPLPDDPYGFELNWLGNAPFMQVEVDNSSALPSSLTGTGSQDRTAQALALHVELSDKTFQSGFSGKTHLKVEAFFNGQLSACSLIHTNDIRSGAKSLHQVFAGYRVDFLAERPWVLLPPYTTADGGTRRFRKSITPLERFEEISVALLKEVEERGTHKAGASPPSADFINALAKMQTPASVVNMQKPGGRKFGVIDVIITAGTGHKITSGTTYLKKPQRLQDPDYVVRTEIKSKDNKCATAAPESQEVDDTYRTRSEASISGSDDCAHAFAGEDMDLQKQRSRKYRALSLGKGLRQHTKKGTGLQTTFTDEQVAFLPPPSQTTRQSEVLPAASRVDSRCPSPEHRSDGHKQPLPSTDRNRTFHAIREPPYLQNHYNGSSCISQGYHCAPASLCPSTPDMTQSRPTTSNVSSSVPATGNGLFDASSSPGLKFSASPEAYMRMGYDSRYPQPMWSGGKDEVTPSAPFVAPSAWMLPTATAATNWPASPSSVNTSYFHPVYLPPQARAEYYPSGPTAYNPLNGLPNLIRQSPVQFGYPVSPSLGAPATSSSSTLWMNRPLPPTAMFSVPSKPRRNPSPTKCVPVKPFNSETGVLVRRLVIMAQNGRSIVDHRWKSDRYISAGRRPYSEEGARDPANALKSNGDQPDSSSQPQQRSLSPERRAKSLGENAKSATSQQGLREQRRDSVQDEEPGVPKGLSLPYLKRHQAPTNEISSINPRIDVPDSIAPFVSAEMQSPGSQIGVPRPVQITQPVLPIASSASHSRAITRTSIPGIQGPKAATFLFDDPEEVLREAARMRRSRSPTKPAANHGESSVAALAPTKTAPDQGGLHGSSSLSSVPSSSSPERSDVTINPQRISVDDVPQFDGLSESTLPVASLRNSSFEEPGLSRPEFQRPVLATPQPVSPKSKKRKFTTRSPVKIPRSPDRLKTVSNPYLNNDCVIAFAESADKSEKKGVLRQVKGERQGVFKEDHVVLAVRLFIPGG